MEQRILNFERKLAQSDLDGFLVTDLLNIYYLTGFSGTEATVFISKNRRLFLTDARYVLAAQNTVSGFEIIESRRPLAEIAEIVKADRLVRLGFDHQVTFAYYQKLQTYFAGIDLVALADFTEELRLVKDPKEIAAIRMACRITDQAFADVLDFIKPGVTTEWDLANFLDFRMRKYGASGLSFTTIAASGCRSAMPHGTATEKVIQNGEMLTLDFGCYYNHYVSDMTRTVHIGPATDEEGEIYDTVLRANQALIRTAKAGLSYRDFDSIPREVIEQAGFGQDFTHGIGHGIGLDVHELPYFSGTDGILRAGMVVTDEPGIYLDNKYGVRIEDDLLITEDGCEVLTESPKELLILS
ncbi:M24 family metallopeptidase [Streptococcus pantholopis]|uniref:X-Pro aminopeptidase n=1 Tax=Streptococcus pantholopis TaxID=1811193 RepID=A0A172Q5D7_9STRE|nr:Xaa-Pro peptidase family protein [Streptococcus pantholopis]AND78667.1 X-Pro aminopeptidase [Streptococcus pantholopis]